MPSASQVLAARVLWCPALIPPTGARETRSPPSPSPDSELGLCFRTERQAESRAQGMFQSPPWKQPEDASSLGTYIVTLET